MYSSHEEAQQDLDRMTGWSNPRIVEEADPDITGLPIIYILAEDEYGYTVIFDSPDQEQARRL